MDDSDSAVKTAGGQFRKTGRISWPLAFVLYSAIFAALYSFIFLILRKNGYGPFAGPDSSLFFGRIVYIGEYIRNLPHSFYFYDFRIGLGDDIFNFLWEGALNPVVFLVAPFFRVEQAETAYWIICALHMYISGIAFMFFCRYRRNDAFASACGAVAYIFSGFALFHVFRDFQFMTAMIILPAMFSAAEAALCEERLLPLVFVTALSFAVNFYFAAMITLMLLIYAAARFFEVYTSRRKQNFFRLFFKCAAAYMLGAMLAAPALLPIIAKFAESGRGGAPIVYGCLYPVNNISYSLLYFFSPGGMRGIGASLLPITFFAAVCFFRRKFSYERWLKIFLLIFCVGIFSPVITRIFSFGTGSCFSKRWSFIFPFIFSYMLVIMFQHLAEPEEKDRTSCLAAMLVYCLLVLLLHILKLYGIDKYIIVSLLTLFTTAVFICAYRSRKAARRKIILALLVLISASANIYYLYEDAPDDAAVNAAAIPESGFKKHLIPAGTMLMRYEKNRRAYRIADSTEMPSATSFFRIDTSNLRGHNYILFGQYSIYSYGSLMTKYPDYLIGLENRAAHLPWQARGCDDIASLESMLSVKYFVAEKKDAAYVPYGFEEKRADVDYTLYENRCFLPLGYTYEKCIPQSEYEKLSAFEKIESQLQAAALKELPPGFQNMNTDRFRYVNVPFTLTHTGINETKNGIIVVSGDKANTEVEFTPLNGAEMYIRLKGVSIVNSEREIRSVFLSGSGFKKYTVLVSKTNASYCGRENYLVRLGSYDAQKVRCRISWRPGFYRFGGIQVYAVPMGNYPARINKLREDVLENIYVGNDKVSGTISLKKNKILCLSIPYSKGWHAKADGKNAKLLKANSFFMALPLEAGDHKIELEYHVPGLRLGLCLFALGAAILSGMIIQNKRKKAAE
ncbi:MAG: YfhO family protein [Synergistes sp.]|nr:YfhO family protein [Synergistes sp.]